MIWLITSTGIFITGSSNQNSSCEDILIMKVGFQGEIIWQNTIGYEGRDYGTKVILDNDNAIIIVGTGFFGNNEKICLIKLDENGNLSKL